MGKAVVLLFLVTLPACRAEPLTLGGTTGGVVNGGDDLASASSDLETVVTTVHLDQAHAGVAGEWTSISLHVAQTFTVGVDGSLVGIECLFVHNGDGVGAIVMDLSNEATQTKLGTSQIDSSAALPQFATASRDTALPLDTIGSGYFAFADGIPVTTGQVLRFGFSGAEVMVASGPAPFEGGVDYPGGQEYCDDDTLGREVLFKTFVAY